MLIAVAWAGLKRGHESFSRWSNTWCDYETCFSAVFVALGRDFAGGDIAFGFFGYIFLSRWKTKAGTLERMVSTRW